MILNKIKINISIKEYYSPYSIRIGVVKNDIYLHIPIDDVIASALRRSIARRANKFK